MLYVEPGAIATDRPGPHDTLMCCHPTCVAVVPSNRGSNVGMVLRVCSLEMGGFSSLGLVQDKNITPTRPMFLEIAIAKPKYPRPSRAIAESPK